MLRTLGLIGIVVVLLGGYTSYALLRPLPELRPTILAQRSYAAKPVHLAWPTYGTGAIGAVDYGVLESHGNDDPLPTASTIKVLTALLVLNQKPLQPGEQGPMITIEQSDIDSYNKYVAANGSVVRVTLGEQISEYQALQALLLPSANNMAETLARWTSGSVEAFNRYAGEYAIALGLNHTTITDPSGFLSTTVSSPHDLVLLGMAALHNPVVAEIIDQPSATIPVQGTVYNYNVLLGQHGIIGIKTGNNDQNPGCYLFAAKQAVMGHDVTVVGVIMNAPNLWTAIRDSVPLLESTTRAFAPVAIADKHRSIGNYQSPWGTKAEIIPESTATVLVWRNSDTSIEPIVSHVRVPAKQGTTVGQLVVHNSSLQTSSEVPLVLKDNVIAPTIWWRLTHPW